MTTTTQHPLRGEPTRLDQVQEYAFRYWWLGVLGLWDWVHPAMAVFYLAFLGPVVGLLLQWHSNAVSPTAWITQREPTGLRGRLGAAWAAVYPVADLTDLYYRLAVAVVRGRGLTPAPEEFNQQLSLRLPFDGEWTVLTGSPDADYAYTTKVSQHRYAYTFVITDEDGATYDRSGATTDPDSHYCYDAPVFAPADGTVQTVRDGHPDGTRADGAPNVTYRSPYGNYVVIDHGEFVSVLGHLKANSVSPTEGEHVQAGELIGACGYSGNAAEPQLHMHVQDRARLPIGIGLPVGFRNVVTDRSGETDDEQRLLHSGQRVSHGGKSVAPTDPVTTEETA